MYQNLKDSMAKKGISTNAASKLVGMPEATFRTKLQERSFSVEEAFCIRENLFPEMDFFYLFKRIDSDMQESA